MHRSSKVKCCNCQGEHLAPSTDCSKFKEQEKRIQNMINQHSLQTVQTITKAPDLNNIAEFPLLNNGHQRNKNYF
ncbi:unnamed protein product [Rotaria sp. Silwood2]|nr:unnamed protein product [Rotaria sp. Silwood2]CAF4625697.1 unnamed protein product [Rotaria sp. Silwood2]